MKAYMIIAVVAAGLGLALLAAACARAGPPPAREPRAVTGTVEVRVGAHVHRYSLRVHRGERGFVPVLRPAHDAAVPTHRVARLPFVRESSAEDTPVVLRTAHGIVETRFIYRPLGPWQVLDRAVTSLRLATPTGERTVALVVALCEPRLEA